MIVVSNLCESKLVLAVSIHLTVQKSVLVRVGDLQVWNINKHQRIIVRFSLLYGYCEKF